MSNRYPLKHTAEAINRKLDLIAENKNLLPYPYEEAFPTDLTDVGDGSILTSSNRVSDANESLTLGTFALPEAGTYEVSLAITNILDEIVGPHAFSLSVLSEGTNILNSENSFTIEDPEKSVVVQLNIPNVFNADWLIKPQIVKSGEDTTTWVPYMKTIGSYVDERFKSTNAKIKFIKDSVDELSRKAGTEAGLVMSGGDVTIVDGIITVNDDSHNHIISNIDGLETKLSSIDTSITNLNTNKADITHAHSEYVTNSDYRLSNSRNPTSHANSANTYGSSSDTLYGHAKASKTTPTMNGSAALGKETDQFARGDHVHPTDTSRAAATHSHGNISSDGIVDGIVAPNAAIYTGTGGKLIGGVLPVSAGGTGVARLGTSDGILMGNDTAGISTHPYSTGAFFVPNSTSSPTWGGTLPISCGGTGATTAAAARANLGIDFNFSTTPITPQTLEVKVYRSNSTSDYYPCFIRVSGAHTKIEDKLVLLNLNMYIFPSTPPTGDYGDFMWSDIIGKVLGTTNSPIPPLPGNTGVAGTWSLLNPTFSFTTHSTSGHVTTITSDQQELHGNGPILYFKVTSDQYSKLVIARYYISATGAQPTADTMSIGGWHLDMLMGKHISINNLPIKLS